MTKEELKKEAEEKAKKRTNGFKCQENCEKSYVMGAIDFGEPREKRIAELELKIKKMTQHLEPQEMTALFEQVEEEVEQEQRTKELESEITKLRIYNEKLLDGDIEKHNKIVELEEENSRLKQIILGNEMEIAAKDETIEELKNKFKDT